MHHKALHLLFLALSKMPASLDYEVRVLGKGPLERRWRRLAEEIGVASRVTFIGWLQHQEALAQNEWADVFAFTSLRDTSGMVVLESLGAEAPVICLDHRGVGDIITPECGIKVPVTTPNEVILGLRDAIVSLAQDREKLAALSRAQECTWARTSKELIKVYHQVLAAPRGGNGR